MARPINKQELLELSGTNYSKLLSLIESLPNETSQADFPERYLNRNISDVFAHLHHWHLMMLEWYKVGMEGDKPDMPAKGYIWKALPDLNKKIWEQYQDLELVETKNLLEDSFNDIQKLIEKHTDQELFEKKRYPWTGSTSLGSYLISATSSHYDWAHKLIKKCIKELEVNE